VNNSESKARLELRARIEDRLVSDEDTAAARSVLLSAAMGYLATSAAGWPYVIPMAFAYDGAVVYFHGGEGLMSSMLADDPRVCIAVTTNPVFVPGPTPCETTVRYESVLVFGRATPLEQDGERRQALRTIVAKYQPGDERPFVPEGLASTVVYRLSIDALTYKRSEGH
jgi:uncharacterized protein